MKHYSVIIRSILLLGCLAGFAIISPSRLKAQDLAVQNNDFGIVQLGLATVLPVQVVSQASFPISFLSFSVVDATPDFIVDSRFRFTIQDPLNDIGCPLTLVAGMCTVNIMYTPNSVGQDAGRLEIAYCEGEDHSCERPVRHSFDLTGRAVSVETPDRDANEAGSTGEFRIGRSGFGEEAGGELTVTYQVGGTATAGVDYVPLSGLVTVPDGVDSAALTVIPLADGVSEPDETVVIAVVGNGSVVGLSPNPPPVVLADTVSPVIRPVPALADAISDGIARVPSLASIDFECELGDDTPATVDFTLAVVDSDFPSAQGTLFFGDCLGSEDSIDVAGLLDGSVPNALDLTLTDPQGAGLAFQSLRLIASIEGPPPSEFSLALNPLQSNVPVGETGGFRFTVRENNVGIRIFSELSLEVRVPPELGLLQIPQSCASTAGAEFSCMVAISETAIFEQFDFNFTPAENAQNKSFSIIADLLSNDANSSNNMVAAVVNVVGSRVNPGIPPSGSGSRLLNISTNGFVDGGGMIAGFIVTGTGAKRFAVIGEDAVAGDAVNLTDPVLEVFDFAGGQFGPLLDSNDNWRDHPTATELATALREPNTEQSAGFTISLPPGVYVARVSGRNGSVGRAVISVQEIGD